MSEQVEIQDKRIKHTGCWLILLLLLAVIIAIGAYFYKKYTEKCEWERGEQQAWLDVERFDDELLLDSLDKALNFYQENYPDGRHAEQVLNVRLRVDSERRDWKLLQRQISVENLDDFIRDHSDGYFRKYASRMIDSLLFHEAEETDTYEAYAAYVDEYEDGLFTKTALERMKELAGGSVGRGDSIAVANTIHNHFDALAHADKQMLLSTLAADVLSYIGKKEPTHADIVNYMTVIHADAGRNIEFDIHELDISKQVEDGTVSYTAKFMFDEYIETDDTEEVRSFVAISHLDSDQMIFSLAFKAQ